MRLEEAGATLSALRLTSYALVTSSALPTLWTSRSCCWNRNTDWDGSSMTEHLLGMQALSLISSTVGEESFRECRHRVKPS